jgi:hypothetical protein
MNQSENNFCEGITPLSPDELRDISGGGFWSDFFYATKEITKGIFEFGKLAVAFQQTLPANLKK